MGKPKNAKHQTRNDRKSSAKSDGGDFTKLKNSLGLSAKCNITDLPDKKLRKAYTEFNSICADIRLRQHRCASQADGGPSTNQTDNDVDSTATNSDPIVRLPNTKPEGSKPGKLDTPNKDCASFESQDGNTDVMKDMGTYLDNDIGSYRKPDGSKPVKSDKPNQEHTCHECQDGKGNVLVGMTSVVDKEFGPQRNEVPEKDPLSEIDNKEMSHEPDCSKQVTSSTPGQEYTGFEFQDQKADIIDNMDTVKRTENGSQTNGAQGNYTLHMENKDKSIGPETVSFAIEDICTLPGSDDTTKQEDTVEAKDAVDSAQNQYMATEKTDTSGRKDMKKVGRRTTENMTVDDAGHRDKMDVNPVHYGVETNGTVPAQENDQNAEDNAGMSMGHICFSGVTHGENMVMDKQVAIFSETDRSKHFMHEFEIPCRIVNDTDIVPDCNDSNNIDVMEEGITIRPCESASKNNVECEKMDTDGLLDSHETRSQSPSDGTTEMEVDNIMQDGPAKDMLVKDTSGGIVAVTAAPQKLPKHGETLQDMDKSDTASLKTRNSKQNLAASNLAKKEDASVRRTRIFITPQKPALRPVKPKLPINSSGGANSAGNGSQSGLVASQHPIIIVTANSNSSARIQVLTAEQKNRLGLSANSSVFKLPQKAYDKLVASQQVSPTQNSGSQVPSEHPGSEVELNSPSIHTKPSTQRKQNTNKAKPNTTELSRPDVTSQRTAPVRVKPKPLKTGVQLTTSPTILSVPNAVESGILRHLGKPVIPGLINLAQMSEKAQSRLHQTLARASMVFEIPTKRCGGMETKDSKDELSICIGDKVITEKDCDIVPIFVEYDSNGNITRCLFDKLRPSGQYAIFENKPTGHFITICNQFSNAYMIPWVIGRMDPTCKHILQLCSGRKGNSNSVALGQVVSAAKIRIHESTENLVNNVPTASNYCQAMVNIPRGHLNGQNSALHASMLNVGAPFAGDYYKQILNNTIPVEHVPSHNIMLVRSSQPAPSVPIDQTSSITQTRPLGEPMEVTFANDPNSDGNQVNKMVTYPHGLEDYSALYTDNVQQIIRDTCRKLAMKIIEDVSMVQPPAGVEGEDDQCVLNIPQHTGEDGVPGKGKPDEEGIQESDDLTMKEAVRQDGENDTSQLQDKRVVPMDESPGVSDLQNTLSEPEKKELYCRFNISQQMKSIYMETHNARPHVSNLYDVQPVFPGWITPKQNKSECEVGNDPVISSSVDSDDVNLDDDNYMRQVLDSFLEMAEESGYFQRLEQSGIELSDFHAWVNGETDDAFFEMFMAKSLTPDDIAKAKRMRRAHLARQRRLRKIEASKLENTKAADELKKNDEDKIPANTKTVEKWTAGANKGVNSGHTRDPPPAVNEKTSAKRTNKLKNEWMAKYEAESPSTIPELAQCHTVCTMTEADKHKISVSKGGSLPVKRTLDNTSDSSQVKKVRHVFKATPGKKKRRSRSKQVTVDPSKVSNQEKIHTNVSVDSQQDTTATNNDEVSPVVPLINDGLKYSHDVRQPKRRKQGNKHPAKGEKKNIGGHMVDKNRSTHTASECMRFLTKDVNEDEGKHGHTIDEKPSAKTVRAFMRDDGHLKYNMCEDDRKQWDHSVERNPGAKTESCLVRDDESLAYDVHGNHGKKVKHDNVVKKNLSSQAAAELMRAGGRSTNGENDEGATGCSMRHVKMTKGATRTTGSLKIIKYDGVATSEVKTVRHSTMMRTARFQMNEVSDDCATEWSMRNAMTGVKRCLDGQGVLPTAKIVKQEMTSSKLKVTRQTRYRGAKRPQVYKYTRDKQ